MRRFTCLGVRKAYVYAYELQEGGTGRAFRFPNTLEGWAQFCATVDGSVHVALEVTGNAYRCYDLVSPHAGKVLRVDPSAWRRLGVKTDKLDAKTMAEQLALGLIPEVWVPPAPIRELRVLIKYSYGLVRRRTMFKDSLKAVLLRNELLPLKHTSTKLGTSSVTAHGEVWQVRPLTEDQKALFRTLQVPFPPNYLKTQLAREKET